MYAISCTLPAGLACVWKLLFGVAEQNDIATILTARNRQPLAVARPGVVAAASQLAEDFVVRDRLTNHSWGPYESYGGL